METHFSFKSALSLQLAVFTAFDVWDDVNFAYWRVSMKKSLASFGILASLAILAGCNSGITYGTGTSHEQQTVEGLTNMFALKADDNSDKIDYSSRPDLVMPATKGNLPQPDDTQPQGEDSNWPVSPEERIAKLRGEAPEVQRGGELPAEYLSDTNKNGIKVSSTSQRGRRKIDRHSSDANFINLIRDDANGEGENKLARERQEEISFSTGVKRKYLTEPPTIYRTPSSNAEAGDLGIGKEEVDKRAEEIKAKRRTYKRDALPADGQ